MIAFLYLALLFSLVGRRVRCGLLDIFYYSIIFWSYGA